MHYCLSYAVIALLLHARHPGAHVHTLKETKMKMLPEHFAHMRARLEIVDTSVLRGRYANAGHSTKRYQWDAVRNAGLMPWFCDTLYTYLNDDHIQTALNKLIKPL